MQNESEQTLRTKMKSRIKKLGEAGLFISGSVVKSSRVCGNPNCKCALKGEKHVCCIHTQTIQGKTRTTYIPVDMADEVKTWNNEYKRIKKLLKEIDDIGKKIIKIHSKTSRKRKANIREVHNV